MEVSTFSHNSDPKTPWPLEIFFVCCEEKDLMSLLPIWSAVRAVRPEARLLTLGFSSAYAQDTLGAAFSLLLSARFPIIVSSSPDDWLRKLRPRWSYYFVGVEHGLSPFKKFTYGNSFLEYDEYFAPSVLWKERLAHLYPHARTRFHAADYPKTRQFLALAEPKNKDLSREGNLPNTVVIFSWGVREDALFSLPDLKGVTYLLHPAQTTFSRPAPFLHAQVLRSTTDTTLRILGNSDRIFGDISSLTFEMAAILPTWLFIDRSFYIDEYDIEDEIMDPNHVQFACIPQTEYQIDPSFILDRAGLVAALTNGSEPVATPLGQETMLVPTLKTEGPDLCTSGILEICTRLAGELSIRGTLMPDVAAAEFIRNAYLQILGREPDLAGLSNYMKKMMENDESVLIQGLEFMLVLLRSQEAQSRLELPRNVWPVLNLTTNPST